LSARLSGWRVDIKSETQLAEEEARYGEEWAEGEWVENDAGEMVWQPAEGGEAVSATEWSRVVAGDEDDPSKTGASTEAKATEVSADSSDSGAAASDSSKEAPLESNSAEEPEVSASSDSPAAGLAEEGSG
jgi:hypothetical protein